MSETNSSPTQSKKPSQAKSSKKLRIRQVRSPIGFTRGQREVLRGLGLRRIRDEVVREDTPAVRGMAAKISHLVKIIEEG
ncbi:MAG: 50S ribosomal protein L30 [Acidobacteriota bacterium]|nr:MAG: 50S ribosomal protein L30 [Acidobacteriota bacterium]